MGWRIARGGNFVFNSLKPRTALFADRADGGLRLAQKLSAYAGRTDTIVLGLPRGGVPVAAEVAKELRAPLDLFLVRKLGVPGHEELAMGAIASGGVQVLNREVVEQLRIPLELIDSVAQREQQELARREKLYRNGQPAPELEGRTAILVDDGLATGASMSAAVAALRAHQPARIVVAVPTAAPETCKMFEEEVDEVVCAETPQPFVGVGFWYKNFAQTTDEEVRRLLEEARQIPHAPHEAATSKRGSAAIIQEQQVEITANGLALAANLRIPAGAYGLVLFAHGSGSSRFSPRNRAVADLLYAGGLATLLLDLLTPSEEEIDQVTRRLRFNIPLLAERLVGTTDWLLQQPQINSLPIGYFGASTGAAAALMAAVQRPNAIRAVVSRGGRPDLAASVLKEVRAPTLLIVGENDIPVFEMNRAALAELSCAKELTTVSGASHLFEEPGTLAQVAQLARNWFKTYLEKEGMSGNLSES